MEILSITLQAPSSFQTLWFPRILDFPLATRTNLSPGALIVQHQTLTSFQPPTQQNSAPSRNIPFIGNAVPFNCVPFTHSFPEPSAHGPPGHFGHFSVTLCCAWPQPWISHPGRDSALLLHQQQEFLPSCSAAHAPNSFRHFEPSKIWIKASASPGSHPGCAQAGFQPGVGLGTSSSPFLRGETQTMQIKMH